MTNKSKYKEEFNYFKEIIEKNLDNFVEIKYPDEIYNSMKYSLNAGGKRLRPVMTLEVCKMLSGNYKDAIPTACAVEMLHTQSLIHDDLPCMDNDDYRRGKLTNHKVFSESTAVLAGDALISFAPSIIIDKTPKNISPQKILQVIREFCAAAGVEGIISGQIADIDSENKKISPETLNFIHEYKTSKLFVLALKAGAIIAGASDKQIKDMENFALAFGHAFQIYDDILDETATLEELGKTPGKDAKAHKATYTSLFGIEKAKCEVKRLCKTCCDILNDNGYNSYILNGIVSDIIERVC